MFNNETQNNNYTFGGDKIIEKTITPDKVTEMYDKIKQEIEENTIRKVVIHHNQIKGIIFEFREDESTLVKKIFIRFKLNDKDIIVKKELEYNNNPSLNCLINTFKETYAEEVAKYISSCLLDDFTNVYEKKIK